MKLELSEWGDGTIRLSFWDLLHGDDIHFILNLDGSASRSCGYDENDEEITEAVEKLPQALRNLLAEREHESNHN